MLKKIGNLTVKIKNSEELRDLLNKNVNIIHFLQV